MTENEDVLNIDSDIAEDEQDLYEHFRFEVDKGQGLLRIDKFLLSRIENTSRNKIQNAAENGCILVNDKAVKSNYRVKPFDKIAIVMSHPPREVELIPENISLNIVYEDHDLIIINKPAGMVVHPAYGNYRGTLANALLYHFQKSSNNDGIPSFPGLVHRIDKNTSGLLVIAKNEISQTILAKQFFEHTIERKYIAIVWGSLKDDEGTITGNIGRNLKDRKIMAVFTDGTHGKHAITHYKVIKRFNFVTLIECRLETGRTHQIRAHFKYIGHPLFNDETYGGDIILKGTNSGKYKQFIENCFSLLPRQALHAKSLGFIHPINKKPVFFESDLPNDMKAVLEKWERYSYSAFYMPE
ncbi:MAG: RluA family pseudouridine synthase [Bacteroidota bacterium]|nr:RluA family pseudouridine synthase [Bacteroidota bacterium]